MMIRVGSQTQNAFETYWANNVVGIPVAPNQSNVWRMDEGAWPCTYHPRTVPGRLNLYLLSDLGGGEPNMNVETPSEFQCHSNI